MEEKLTEQEQIRREKLDELRKLGVDPFGKAFKRTHTNQEIIDYYGDLDKALEERILSYCCWKRYAQATKRVAFITLQDRDAQINCM